MKILKFFILFLSLFILALTILFQFVPLFLSKKVIPVYASNNGITGLSLNIQKLGISSTVIDNIHLGTADQTGLLLDSLKVEYQPSRLLNNQIDSISLSGLQCAVTIDQDGFVVSGVNIPKKDKISTPESNHKNSPTSILDNLPIKFEKFQIRNSSCTVNYYNQLHTIPFEIQVIPSKNNDSTFDIQATIIFSGKEINLSGNIDLTNSKFTAEIKTEALPIFHPNGPLQHVNIPLNFSTTAEISGSVTGTLVPFKPVYDFTVQLNNLEIASDNFKAGSNDYSAPNNKAPVILQATGGTENISATISHLYIKEPLPLKLSNLTLEAVIEDSHISGTSNMEVEFPQNFIKGISTQNEILLKSTTQFSITDSIINLSSQLDQIDNKSLKNKSNSFFWQNFQINSGLPKLHFSGKSDQELTKIQFKTNIPNITIQEQSEVPNTQKNSSVLLDSFSFQGTFTHNQKDQNSIISSAFNGSAKNLNLLQESFFTVSSDIDFSGQFEKNLTKSDSPFNLNSMTKFSNGSLTITDSNINCDKISASLPFIWPLSNSKGNREGSFSFPKIESPDFEIGDLVGDIRQNDSSFTIEGQYLSKVFPNLIAKFSTDIGWSDRTELSAKTNFSIPKYHFNSEEIDLPELYDIDTQGDFKLNGNTTVTKSGINGEYNIDISNTSIKDYEGNFSLEGLGVNLNFPKLTELKSDPGRLLFQKANVGDLAINGGSSTFQIESSKSVLIEKSSINWSSGFVDLLGTRINIDDDKHNLMLYCNGLNLAELLSQLGISNVKGDGKVNGKIPLTFDNGKLSFADAFLYSTPGTSGSINIDNSDILLSGIPKKSPQYAQLDFAGEALKDFKYKWVTIEMTSLDDSALFAMKLSGKPAKPLPFSYDTNINSFVRLNTWSKGIDYPIDLDVNFHLPLNKILNYGTSLKDIFGN